jgi:DNA-binding MarR family transcriptional regulator
VSTTTATDLAEDLLVLHGRIRRSLLAGKADDITASQTAVLGRLVRDGAQAAADLARAEGVRPQSMGATVQALEDAGLVVRESDPNDGRRQVVRVTPAGQDARSAAHRDRTAVLTERLAALPADDRAAIARALVILGEVVDP